MCEFCEGDNPRSIISMRSRGERTDLYIDYRNGWPNLVMECLLGGMPAFHATRIRNCPMCGRVLERKVE